MKHHATSCASQSILSLYWHYAYNMIYHATSCASQSILSNIFDNAYNTLYNILWITEHYVTEYLITLLTLCLQRDTSCNILCIPEHSFKYLTQCHNTLDLTTSWASQSILSHKWQSKTSCYILCFTEYLITLLTLCLHPLFSSWTNISINSWWLMVWIIIICWVISKLYSLIKKQNYKYLVFSCTPFFLH